MLETILAALRTFPNQNVIAQSVTTTEKRFSATDGAGSSIEIVMSLTDFPNDNLPEFGAETSDPATRDSLREAFSVFPSAGRTHTSPENNIKVFQTAIGGESYVKLQITVGETETQEISDLVFGYITKNAK
ncbi:MAG: hypothetical protein K1X86_15460 [Ignavibacteria bacterium]|nr:hypothetical protein [Ignavibacteria bacterium]